MATLEEKEALMQVLKWTPRTYKISMWGYGGEKTMGAIQQKNILKNILELKNENYSTQRCFPNRSRN